MLLSDTLSQEQIQLNRLQRVEFYLTDTVANLCTTFGCHIKPFHCYLVRCYRVRPNVGIFFTGQVLTGQVPVEWLWRLISFKHRSRAQSNPVSQRVAATVDAPVPAYLPHHLPHQQFPSPAVFQSHLP